MERMAANTWCYRDLPVEEAASRIAAFGLRGIELVAHAPCWHADPRASEEEIGRLKRMLAEKGLVIVAVSPATDYLKFTPEEQRQQIEHTKANVDLAVKLGAQVVRIFAGGEIPEGRSWDECVRTVADQLRECAKYAEEMGVKLGIESHGKFGTDLNALAAIIERVDSPALGLTLDTANFYVNGVDPVEAAKRLSGRIFHTHLKDAKRLPDGSYKGAALGEGDVPIREVVGELKRQGYKGWFCIEYEGEEHPDVGLRKSVEFLRRLPAIHLVRETSAS